jgi:capsule biosynthesis phosphatase
MKLLMRELQKYLGCFLVFFLLRFGLVLANNAWLAANSAPCEPIKISRKLLQLFLQFPLIKSILVLSYILTFQDHLWALNPPQINAKNSEKFSPVDFSAKPVNRVNIVIPLGGIGRRFNDEGYSRPKPLINVFGHPILFWLLDSIPSQYHDDLYLGYNSDLDNNDFSLLLKKHYPKIHLIRLPGPTRGAAETLVKIVEQIPEEERRKPLISLDGDTFYHQDIVADFIRNFNQTQSGMVYCFRCDQANSAKPIFSYLKLNESGEITEIVEKKRISNLANTGCYGFPNSEQLLTYAKKFIAKGNLELGELYTSSLIRDMITLGVCSFRSRELPKTSVTFLGTPIQVKVFVNNLLSDIEHEHDIQINLPKKRFCFDLDDTLVTSPEVPGDYSTVKPIPQRILLVRQLKSLGHHIIIQTARRMRTHKGNVGHVLADIGQVTFDTLKKYDIPYDELYFGKPYADFYIDDKAVLATDHQIHKELGFYSFSVEGRSFHHIEQGKSTIVKTAIGHDHSLGGEINWYHHIPNQIEDLFPRIISFSDDLKSMTLERIRGYTLSALYVQSEIQPETLKKIVQAVERIHNVFPPDKKPEEIDIYANYSQKLDVRYSKYEGYNKFPNVTQIYESLSKFCKSYEKAQRGHPALIHGDPVFTNVLMDEYGQFKFIDMRGKIGKHVSQWGDVNYDFAKILQSLAGYDHILHGVPINEGYRNMMISEYRNALGCTDEQWNDICNITANLLFTLIPLHDNEKCTEYYDLITFLSKLKRSR